jgi:hypothetical protein
MLNERVEFARQMGERSRPHDLRYGRQVCDEAERQLDAIRQVTALDRGVTG